MRIAWFSPIAEGSTLKSAAYTRNVLRHVPAAWEIELFVGDAEWLALAAEEWEPNLWRYRAFPHQSAFLRHERKPFDMFVMQLEDRPQCAFVQSALRAWPGVLFLHDLNLSRLEASVVKHVSSEEGLNELRASDKSSSAPRLADLQLRGWSMEIFERMFPLGLGSVVDASVVVVDNERSVDEIKNRSPQTPVELTVIPVRALSAAAAAAERRSAREQLGFTAESPVIGFAGRYRLEDRAYHMLHALKSLRSAGPCAERDARLLWIVQDAEAEENALRVLSSCGDPEGVTLVRAEDEQLFTRFVAAADVMVCLKFDVLRGHPPAIQAALAAGVPLITTGFGPTDELPNAAAWKLGVGRGEEAELTAALEQLLTKPEVSRAFSEGGRAYVETVLDPAAAALDLETILQKHRRRIADALVEREMELNAARHALVQQLYASVGDRDVVATGGGRPDESLAVARRVSERAVNDFHWG